MSGAAQGDQNTTKTNVSDVKDNSKPLDGSGNKPPAAQLEEDDEFEDFPVEGTSLKTESSGRLYMQIRASTLPLSGHSQKKTLLTLCPQTGRKKRNLERQAVEQERHICGRRAGTTMTQVTSSHSN